MAIRLTDFYTAPAIADNWTEVQSNLLPYLGTAFFTPRKKAGLDISWLKGNKGLPVSLAPSAFDAKSTFRDRIGVSKVETELCFFRESMLVKEKDEQDIMRCLDSNDPYAVDVLNRVFDDTRTLVDGAMVVPERMIWQLMAPVSGNCGINIEANSASYVYNYDPDGSWKTNNYTALTGTGLWSAIATATPMTDFRTIQRAAMKLKGVKLTTAVMSQTTFDYLLENAQIKSGILAQNATANIFLDDDMLAAFIQRKFGISIVIYEKQYKDEAGTAHNFYPDGYVTFIPDGSIGSLWYGTTPEERTLLGSNNGASVSIVNTGVAVAVSTTSDPVNTKTTVSEIVAPSFERMDEVFVAKVA